MLFALIALLVNTKIKLQRLHTSARHVQQGSTAPNYLSPRHVSYAWMASTVRQGLRRARDVRRVRWARLGMQETPVHTAAHVQQGGSRTVRGRRSARYAQLASTVRVAPLASAAAVCAQAASGARQATAHAHHAYRGALAARQWLRHQPCTVLHVQPARHKQRQHQRSVKCVWQGGTSRLQEGRRASAA